MAISAATVAGRPPGCRSRDRLRLIALARQALIAAEDGRVHLIQRRHSDGDYSYIAVLARWSAAQSSRPMRPIVTEEQLIMIASNKHFSAAGRAE